MTPDANVHLSTFGNSPQWDRGLMVVTTLFSLCQKLKTFYFYFTETWRALLKADYFGGLSCVMLRGHFSPHTTTLVCQRRLTVKDSNVSALMAQALHRRSTNWACQLVCGDLRRHCQKQTHDMPVGPHSEQLANGHIFRNMQLTKKNK